MNLSLDPHHLAVAIDADRAGLRRASDERRRLRIARHGAAGRPHRVRHAHRSDDR